MIQDRAMALEALTRLVSAVNNTGGVLIHPEKNITGCAADPDWLDLADAYCLACGALGEEIKTQPDPQFDLEAAIATIKEPGQDFSTPGRKLLELIGKFPAMEPEPEDSYAEDMACPKCGNRGNKRGFRVEFSGLGILLASEFDEDGDHEWDHTSKCYCRGCDFSGTVKDFTFPGLDSELLNRAEEPEGPSCGDASKNLPNLLAGMRVEPISAEAQGNLAKWIHAGMRLFLALDGANGSRIIHSAYKEFELTKARRQARKLNSCNPQLWRLGVKNEVIAL